VVSKNYLELGDRNQVCSQVDYLVAQSNLA